VVDVDLGDRSYPIYIGQHLLQDGARLRQHIPGNRVLIVTNTTIAPLYLQQ
jgi:3-dehydroquinate synthase